MIEVNGGMTEVYQIFNLLKTYLSNDVRKLFKSANRQLIFQVFKDIVTHSFKAFRTYQT